MEASGLRMLAVSSVTVNSHQDEEMKEQLCTLVITFTDADDPTREITTAHSFASTDPRDYPQKRSIVEHCENVEDPHTGNAAKVSTVFRGVETPQGPLGEDMFERKPLYHFRPNRQNRDDTAAADSAPNVKDLSASFESRTQEQRTFSVGLPRTDPNSFASLPSARHPPLTPQNTAASGNSAEARTRGSGGKRSADGNGTAQKPFTHSRTVERIHESYERNRKETRLFYERNVSEVRTAPSRGDGIYTYRQYGDRRRASDGGDTATRTERRADERYATVIRHGDGQRADGAKPGHRAAEPPRQEESQRPPAEPQPSPRGLNRSPNFPTAPPPPQQPPPQLHIRTDFPVAEPTATRLIDYATYRDEVRKLQREAGAAPKPHSPSTPPPPAIVIPSPGQSPLDTARAVIRHAAQSPSAKPVPSAVKEPELKYFAKTEIKEEREQRLIRHPVKPSPVEREQPLGRAPIDGDRQSRPQYGSSATARRFIELDRDRLADSHTFRRYEPTPTPLNTPMSPARAHHYESPPLHDEENRRIRDASLEAFREKVEILKSSKRFGGSADSSRATSRVDSHSETNLSAATASPLADSTVSPPPRSSSTPAPQHRLVGLFTEETTEEIIHEEYERTRGGQPTVGVPLGPKYSKETTEERQTHRFGPLNEPQEQQHSATTISSTHSTERSRPPWRVAAERSQSVGTFGTQRSPQLSRRADSAEVRDSATSPPPDSTTVFPVVAERVDSAVQSEEADRRFFDQIHRNVHLEETVDYEVRRRTRQFDERHRRPTAEPDTTAARDPLSPGEAVAEIADEFIVESAAIAVARPVAHPPPLSVSMPSLERIDEEIVETDIQIVHTVQSIAEREPRSRSVDSQRRRRPLIDQSRDEYLGPLSLLSPQDELRFLEFDVEVEQPKQKRSSPGTARRHSEEEEERRFDERIEEEVRRRMERVERTRVGVGFDAATKLESKSVADKPTPKPGKVSSDETPKPAFSHTSTDELKYKYATEPLPKMERSEYRSNISSRQNFTRPPQRALSPIGQGFSGSRVLKVMTETSSINSGYSPYGGSTAASTIRDTREREKKEMSDLNDRLATYIEKVRFLEAQNRKLATDLEFLRSRWGHDSTSVRDMYEGDIKQARRILDESDRSRRHLIDELHTLQEDIKSYRQRHDDAARARELNKEQIEDLLAKLSTLEAEVSLLRRRVAQLEGDVTVVKKENQQLIVSLQRTRTDLDQETLNRIDYQNQAQTLLEEIEFLRRAHDSEIRDLQAMASRDTTSENREYFKNELAAAIREIRGEYDQLTNVHRSDIESWYKLKVQEIQTQSARHTMEQTYAADEIKRLRTQLAELRGKLADLEGRNAVLEKNVEELNYQLEDDQRTYESALNDRDSQIRKIRDECQLLMVELQMLLDTKQTLDAEIAIYRKMLEGEEDRAGLRQLVEQAVRTHHHHHHGQTETETMRVLRGETSSRQSFQRSAKGNVSILEASSDGRYIILENTHRARDENIGGWKLKRRIDNRRDVVFTFPIDFVLQPGKTVRIWARTHGIASPPDQLVFQEEDSFGTGNHVHTTLYNTQGEERATLIQRSAHQHPPHHQH